MASDGSSGKIPDASPVHGSQAPNSIHPQAASGKLLPPTGTLAASPGSPKSASTAQAATTPAAVVKPDVKPAVQRSTDPQVFTDQLNQHLNDSGLPDQFRLDPAGKLIQQVNPANGKVVGEFAVSEFPALARSIGASGLLLDSFA
jgi:hypothetical protein